jgi:hypothetical protein
LELRLGRSERHRQLAKQLRVRVERVADLAPLLVGKLRPSGRHSLTLRRSSHQRKKMRTRSMPSRAGRADQAA